MARNSRSSVPMQRLSDDEDTARGSSARMEPRESTRFSGEGVSESDVAHLRQEYGFNEVATKRVHPFRKFLMFFWGPIEILMEIAIILSAVIQSWVDFGVILGLLIVNAIVGFLQEHSAAGALDALKAGLAQESKVRRDGEWRTIPARELVPGDVIRLKLGDIIPADVRLTEGDGLMVDQSALTGESLLSELKTGDQAFSSSVVRMGEMEAVVTAIGGSTKVGKTTHLLAETEHKSNMSIILSRLGNFLIVTAAVFVLTLLVINILREKPVLKLISFLAVLAIAALPVGMPTVISITLAVGAKRLAAHKVIVSRLTAVEEVAGMDILCSDKTGTLTKNELTIDKSQPAGTFTESDVLFYASLASRKADQDAIDKACVNACAPRHTELASYTELHFTPFDPVSKRTVADIRAPDGSTFSVTKGAPQIIAGLLADGTEAAAVSRAVTEFATRGLRGLAVAKSDTTSGDVDTWKLVGMIPLFDPPRDDAVETIQRVRALGVDVKMITGDQLIIAQETARRLGINDNIYDESIFDDGRQASPQHGALSPPRPSIVSSATSPDDVRISVMEQRLLSAQPRYSYEHAAADRVSALDDQVRMSFDRKRAELLAGAKGSATKYGQANVSRTSIDVRRSASRSSRPRIVLSGDALGEAVERAGGFAQVFPEHKYRVVEVLKERGHVVGMTGDGVNDAPALKKANIGFAVAGATDAARGAASMVLTEPGLSVIVHAIEESRRIFNRMKSFIIYRINATVQLLVFMSLANIIYEFDLDSLLIILLVIANDFTVLTIATDRVPSGAKPQRLNVIRVVILSTLLGLYSMGVTFIVFFLFHVHWQVPIEYMTSVVFLTLSSTSVCTVFLTRTESLCFLSAPGPLLALTVVLAEGVMTLFTVYGVFMPAIGWQPVLIIWGIALLSLLIKDLIKIALNRLLSDEDNFCGTVRNSLVERLARFRQ
eukprot:TRINITY_DN4118_c0_g1_i1.p1 TRINITY_DN4118_c0_g1~~TRINITY_DN4118_c0_g1_i1.p1  ORF type:complete len:988 (+),score=264.96 TRINITY_DN4118_c0_g1_i1:122-2965(+)